MVHVSRLPIILICAAFLALAGCSSGWLESRLDNLQPTPTDPNKEPVGYNG